MRTYVALLRGINVGGKNILPMKELAAILAGLGLSEVRTYIQSGNVVFRSPARRTRDLAADIAAAVGERHGFVPRVLVLPVEELRDAMAANPFPAAEDEPASLHLFFMESEPAAPDLERLASLRSATEEFELVGRVFYLHAPDGIGRSRLAGNVERALGVSGTGRNWRSVGAIVSLATKGAP